MFFPACKDDGLRITYQGNIREWDSECFKEKWTFLGTWLEKKIVHVELLYGGECYIYIIIVWHLKCDYRYKRKGKSSLVRMRI